jgi:hypothetical protein
MHLSLSGSSSNTGDTLSSFFRDTCSTTSIFDVVLIDNLSLENIDPTLHDFQGETDSHPNVGDQSQKLHRAFHAKCVEMGIESLLRLDCENFQEKQWMSICR